MNSIAFYCILGLFTLFEPHRETIRQANQSPPPRWMPLQHCLLSLSLLPRPWEESRVQSMNSTSPPSESVAIVSTASSTRRIATRGRRSDRVSSWGAPCASTSRMDHSSSIRSIVFSSLTRGLSSSCRRRLFPLAS